MHDSWGYVESHTWNEFTIRQQRVMNTQIKGLWTSVLLVKMHQEMHHNPLVPSSCIKESADFHGCQVTFSLCL